MSNSIETWFQFALQQLAAESYLEEINWANPEEVKARLERGNTRLPHDPSTGYTRAPQTLGAEFTERYTVAAHRANDQTGMSATLIRSNADGSYTLAIRSTEYKQFAKGGDRERDGLLAADGEIAVKGFALGQLAALEDFYERQVIPVVGASRIYVTGYSLGGHLATVFTETHADKVLGTHVFNSPGRGEFVGGPTTPGAIAAMIGQFRAVLKARPDASVYANVPAGQLRGRYEVLYQRALQAYLVDPAWNPFAPSDRSAYDDPRYTWAKVVTEELSGAGFVTRPVLPSRVGLGTAGDALITSVYGSALLSDTEVVANSQVHASNKNAVFIEGQPFIEGALKIEERSDFGNTHAITLLVDSLALQRAFSRLDPSLSQAQIESIIRASSAQKQKSVARSDDPDAAEGDSLEKALFALRLATDEQAQEITPSRVPGGFGDIGVRQRFYEELAKLPRSIVTGIIDLTGKSTADIKALAQLRDATGIAVRYALRELIPFAVVGVDYAARFANGELDLYDVLGDRGLTESWLEDRAAFARALYDYNTQNQIGGRIGGDVAYRDLRLGIDLRPSPPVGRSVVFGTTDADTIDGTVAGVSAIVYGLDGADHVLASLGDGSTEGGAGGDLITTGAGKDAAYGGAGADTIRAGASNDLLVGGLGDDTELRGNEGDDVLWGDEAQDGRGSERYAGANYAGRDNLYGDAGKDTLYGGGGNDRLEGGDHDDRLFGDGMDPNDTARTGDDTLVGGAGGDGLQGGAGKDVLWGDAENDDGQIAGGGNDVLSGNAGEDELHGGALEDMLFGGDDDAKDILVGGTGGDTLFGGDGGDFLYGGLREVDDTVDSGFDRLFGEGGNDFLYGGAGRDRLEGGVGDDFLRGGAGNDRLAGGTGYDTYYV